MPVNADKPHLWKADTARSIDWYNEWFSRSAPQAYRDARLHTAAQVEAALDATGYLMRITPEVLRQQPRLLSILRLTATPPLSRDRLCGLTHAPLPLIAGMERDGQIPPQLMESVVDADLQRIGAALTQLADRDIFPWLEHGAPLTQGQIHRAAMIVADRLCIATADTIVRDAQQQRQLTTITRWLEQRGYSPMETTRRLGVDHLHPGTFAVQLTLPVLRLDCSIQGTITVDVAIMPLQAQPGDLPLLIETRVSGDVGRANKKRAEDATKVAELRGSYGSCLRFVLFLCGYVDSGYLGHAAAEGIDWVWEHRIDDLAQLIGDASPAEAWPQQQRLAAASSLNTR